MSNDLILRWSNPLGGFILQLPLAIHIPAWASVLDASSNFRLVATCVQKNAFTRTRTAGSMAGNLDFVNIDGYAVFYLKTRLTNVYEGIKGKDVQLEIFDPGRIRRLP